jgi:hypothetical protein
VKSEVRLAAQVSWSFATALGYLKANRRPVVAKLHLLGKSRRLQELGRREGGPVSGLFVPGTGVFFWPPLGSSPASRVFRHPPIGYFYLYWGGRPVTFAHRQAQHTPLRLLLRTATLSWAPTMPLLFAQHAVACCFGCACFMERPLRPGQGPGLPPNPGRRSHGPGRTGNREGKGIGHGPRRTAGVESAVPVSAL